jgi:heterodisulfide reductase subunit C
METDFLNKVNLKSGENVNKCYSCGTCASGCIFAEEMDYTPTQIMKAISLGYKDLCLNSKTIWICASCQTCTTRCPQGIDIARVIDTLREIALKENIEIKLKDVVLFHRTFLSTLKFFGRLYELGLIGLLKLKTRDFFKDMELGMKMFRKGKISIFPSVSSVMKVNKIFSRVKEKERE